VSAWDEEDGDVSKRVLTCPPTACVPFNCPGHEFFRKGLSGCGIDTLSAPVGTVFGLAFTVSDLSMPPATSEVLRRIMVVSPCGEGHTYCPDLAKPALSTDEHACGTTDCSSRAALLALQPVQSTAIPPFIEFTQALPVSSISNRSAGSPLFSGFVHGSRATSLVQVPFLSQIFVLSVLCSHLSFCKAGAIAFEHQILKKALHGMRLHLYNNSAGSCSIHWCFTESL
jgi:hypothetical protein